jgi:hypothetical protein
MRRNFGSFGKKACPEGGNKAGRKVCTGQAAKKEGYEAMEKLKETKALGCQF